MIKYPEEIKATMWERVLRNERSKTQEICRSSKKQAGPQGKTVVDRLVVVFTDKTRSDPEVVSGQKKTGRTAAGLGAVQSVGERVRSAGSMIVDLKS